MSPYPITSVAIPSKYFEVQICFRLSEKESFGLAALVADHVLHGGPQHHLGAGRAWLDLRSPGSDRGRHRLQHLRSRRRDRAPRGGPGDLDRALALARRGQIGRSSCKEII